MAQRRLFNIVKKEDFFHAKPCDYKILVDGVYIEPQVVQPLPNGAQIIADYYKEKYKVDIRIVDHTQSVESGDNITARFKQFQKETLTTHSNENNQAVGYILMHGLHHAIPVIMTREENKDYLIIFDSTSGSRKKGYYQIANIIPDVTVLLNNGTRQADTGSCVTDALCILKDALRIEGIANYLIKNKLVAAGSQTPSPERKSVATATLLYNNFSIFSMPERLLKSAQVSDYLTVSDADMNAVISTKGTTLEERREKDKLIVTLNRNPPKETGINNYLYQKSQRHAKIILDEVERRNRM